jgi:molybdopterin-guanine dinucleotide biosynthesis protein
LASTSRMALLREMHTDADEPDVEVLLARLVPVDIVFLEGFRLTYYPKLELVLLDRDRRMIALDDPLVLAVTAERPVQAPVPFGSMQTRGVHCAIAAVASSPFAGSKPEYRGRKAASSTPFRMASQ